MIRFFAAHPTAGNLLMILFLALGLMTLPNLKRETFPLINSWKVEISIPYPGATPEDIELEVCKPLEDALDGISFIDEKVCQARQNIGLMTVKMLEQGDFAQFKDDIKTAVDGVSDFPEQSEEPVVKELGRTQNVVAIALTADLPRTELKTLAEQLKQKLLRNPAIPLVQISGFSTRQLLIEISAENLRQYGLSLDQLKTIIAKQNINLPSGSIETSNRETQIRFNDERQTPSGLRDLIILKGASGNEVRLGNIATVRDTFELAEEKIRFNGQSAALLKINKNTIDDSLDVLDAVEEFIRKENARLPGNVKLTLTQDYTSIVKDRINMLATNAWQGLLLVFAVMWLFFTIRYAFWVVMGLPVSFLAGFYIFSFMGITINMISMVALLLALGILMDDAIVIAESIGTQIKRGKQPIKAAIDGTKAVAGGVFSSFLTTLSIFIGLVFLEGDLGQILKVIPIVLISVISISLVEAFFILPSHLNHSLSHAQKTSPKKFRLWFDKKFENGRLKVLGLVETLVSYRYAFLGSVIAVFILSIGMLTSGILKFTAFPAVEGDVVQSRLLMPAGTPLNRTEQVVERILNALDDTRQSLSKNEQEDLVKAITVSYGENSDAMESGPHLATITVDLLTAETRHTKMQHFIDDWRGNVGTIADATALSFKEPAIGPSGRAIEIRIKGDDFEQMSRASYDLQNWLNGYPGVNNVLDDLRPGRPEFTLTLKQGAFNLGLDAQTIANQVRTAFQGVKVLETNVGQETLEVTVKIARQSRDDFADFDNFSIVHPNSGALIPLSSLVEIIPTRSFSRIGRVDNQRTVTLYGDINTLVSNTKEVLSDVQERWLPVFEKRYPQLSISFEGEIKNGAVTQRSMVASFAMGIVGVFILLSFQFKSYIEPVVVLIAIPLALIGVIWGHLIMGLNFTMPSALGFVSLAGIVVNDSILLVQFVKKRVAEGLSVHDAAAKASYDRYRAVFLTSVTTIAGMTPLMFETSLQAQVIIPLATSIVFGIASSTLLVLFVIPCLYSILEDFGFAKAKEHVEV